jgi:hypothetical protein
MTKVWLVYDGLTTEIRAETGEMVGRLIDVPPRDMLADMLAKLGYELT